MRNIKTAVLFQKKEEQSQSEEEEGKQVMFGKKTSDSYTMERYYSSRNQNWKKWDSNYSKNNLIKHW